MFKTLQEARKALSEAIYERDIERFKIITPIVRDMEKKALEYFNNYRDAA